MRTAIYTRLSKDFDGKSANVTIQEAECREYAAERGWEIVHVFSDNDISASRYSKKDRPDYRMLLEAIRAGQVEAVLVTEMPRLYRRMEELLELIALAERTPLQQIQTTDGDGYDLSTGIGVHNAQTAVSNAGLESRKISDRTRRKKRAQAKEGQYSGGPHCYGYTWTPAVRDGKQTIIPGHLDIDPAQARVILDACRWLLAGHSLRGVARRLNEQGHRTTTGAMWRPLNLRRILLSHRIIGIRTHNGMEFPGQWEPILDRETWDRVGAILTAPARMVGADRKGARSYLLTGYMICGRCGGQMIGQAHRNPKSNGPTRRYWCPASDDRGVQTGCGKLARQAEPVEVLVAEAVLTAIDSPDMAKRLAASAGDTEGEMAGLLAEHAKRKQKLNELVEDYGNGLLNREQFAHAKAIVDGAITELQQRMTELTANRTMASVQPGQTFRQAWDDADLDWRRALVASVVEAVVLHPGRPGAQRWSPSGDDPRSWNFDPSKVEIRWRV
jgi:DNA invertase Pin-like site-specific DNA recombinase